MVDKLMFACQLESPYICLPASTDHSRQAYICMSAPDHGGPPHICLAVPDHGRPSHICRSTPDHGRPAHICLSWGCIGQDALSAPPPLAWVFSCKWVKYDADLSGPGHWLHCLTNIYHLSRAGPWTGPRIYRSLSTDYFFTTEAGHCASIKQMITH
jgi:hypothetical protein